MRFETGDILLCISKPDGKLEYVEHTRFREDKCYPGKLLIHEKLIPHRVTSSDSWFFHHPKHFIKLDGAL